MNPQVELLGHVTSQAIPLMAPRVGPQYWLFIEQAFPHAIAIAVLGLAQSLVISRDTEQSSDKGKPMGQAKAAIDQVQRASTLTGQFRCCHRSKLSSFAGATPDRTTASFNAGSHSSMKR